jgi:hypothetical protein
VRRKDTDVAPFFLSEIGDQTISCLIKYGRVKAIGTAYNLTYTDVFNNGINDKRSKAM